MSAVNTQKLEFEVANAGSVSALLISPAKARACYVFAHGAGAGMTHPFMETFAAGLGERGVASLRYQFPYMEKGSRRPDPPDVAHAAVRAAVAEAGRRLSGIALDRGRQILWRTYDVTGAGDVRRSRAFKAWHLWAFRCIRRANHPATAPSISRR